MRVGVVDYGLGNLRSVLNAVRHLGVPDVELVDTPNGIERSERLILPGVGSFPQGMANLDKRGITPRLKDYVASGRPLLGICLGMQLLFEVGEEFGEVEGLGFVPGQVRALRGYNGPSTADLRVPHVGWSGLERQEGSDWKGTMLQDVTDDDTFYFVHSFAPTGCPPENTLASTRFEDVLFPSVVVGDNVIGTQFHPEKSGESGLRLLHHFLSKP